MIILAVTHNEFLELRAGRLQRPGADQHMLYDIKSVLPEDQVDAWL